MAQVVGGFLMPHDPLISGAPEAAPAEQRDAIIAAFDHIACRLVELKVDTVVDVADDHYTVFGPHCLPRCLIVIGDADGPLEPWTRVEKAPFRVNQPLATHIMEYGFENGVDWAVSKSITLDHATSLPIHFCFQSNQAISAVPVLVNCGVEPLIASKRCLEIGQSIRKAVETWPGNERVAVFGTGGLSHWVGMPEMGRVNVAWDHMIMTAVKNRDLDKLLSLSDASIIEDAGNGALEIKNWITALGVAGSYRAKRIEYQPIPQWGTGCGLMELACA